MKRIFILFIAMFALATASQARPRHQHLSATDQAARLSKAMQLSDELSAKFVPLYIKYVGEIDATFKRYPIQKSADGASTDKQLKQNTENRFAIARAIIDIREKYYKKFSKLLTPRQIDVLYRTERSFRPGPPMGALCGSLNMDSIVIIRGDEASKFFADNCGDLSACLDNARVIINNCSDFDFSEIEEITKHADKIGREAGKTCRDANKALREADSVLRQADNELRQAKKELRQTKISLKKSSLRSGSGSSSYSISRIVNNGTGAHSTTTVVMPR